MATIPPSDEVPGPTPEPAPRSRVLIVDDNAATVGLVARHLGHHGIDTQSAPDGAAALAAARTFRPDLVLLDANLPDIDGIEVCRAIKSDPDLTGTLVAFLSAERTGPRHRVEGLNVGADAYLTHPIDEAELVAKVRSLLRLRQAELSARDSRDLYRDLLDAAPIGIAHVALDGIVVTANRALAAILATEPGQLAGRLFDVFLHPDERPRMRAAFAEVTSGRRPPVDREIRLLTATGSTAWALLASRLHHHPDGTPSHIIVALEDITARKVAEAALRDRDHLLHELYEVSHDLIATVAADGRILEANTAFHRALGLERGALRDAPLEAWLAPAYRGAWHASVDRVAGGAGDELFRGSLIGANRTAVHVEGSLARRDTAAGVALRVILHDVTERRSLEEQSLRNQRLDSIGTLAGGIAHDLNNVLAPILLSIDLLRGKAAEAERAEYLDSIERSVRRASDLVRQVLLFARGSTGEKSPVEPALLLRDLARMLRETFPKSIEITCSADPADAAALGTMHANPTQLTQVLLNLCLNARDAMPEGGRLSVGARATAISAEEASIHPGAVAGPAVVFTVSDTGSGIPAAVHGRIFDPFFTTKEVGKGTGLGLPTALGIVRGHGGFIAFRSTPSDGTTFEVYLPATPAAAPRPVSTSSEHRAHGRGELVLVIDDERILRQATERLLCAHGYRVISAADGPEGIAHASAFAGELRAVITDLMMPRLDGFATAAALHEVVPGVPVIAMTGHAGPGVDDRLRASGIV
ncbi:MAG: response regulator, partial [Opitutaceae bacterium]|nr:response regulator [Opitutaceae bacterium]